MRTTFAMIAVVLAADQAAAAGVALPRKAKLGVADAARLKLSADRVAVLNVLNSAAIDAKLVALSKDSRAGVYLSHDRVNAIRTVLTTTGAPGEVRLSASLLKLVPLLTPKQTRKLMDIGNALELIIGDDSQKSLPPKDLPEANLANLPQPALNEARANNWTKSPNLAACNAGQSQFFNVAEKRISPGGDGYLTKSMDDRQSVIAAVEAYETACLKGVPLSGPNSASTARDLPISRLAVLIDKAKAPFCMALHLGGDRFLTARHCLLNAEDGSEIIERSGASIEMVDRSDPRSIPIKHAATQPFSLAGKFSGRQDLLVIEAPTLAATVRARRPANGLGKPLTVAEPAVAIGYFPLANPQQRFPTTVGKRGLAPPWAEALRMTRTDGINYCRVWSRSTELDGSGCVEHSCQTVGGFSGAPVFVDRGVPGTPRWEVAGINVAGAIVKKTAGSCGKFDHKPGGVLGLIGAVAASLPATLQTTVIATNIAKDNFQ